MKRLFPVIHIKDGAQAAQNAAIAFGEGADGIFLIHHRARYGVLFRIGAQIREQFPDKWIGINALDLTAGEAFEKTLDIFNAIWSDDLGFREGMNGITYDRVRKNQKARLARSEHFEFFGGVAFKYQAPILDLENVARYAVPYCDVVTTTGEATGVAADLDKIKRMYKGLNTTDYGAILDKPAARLGIASGITPENVEEYLPYVGDYLVSTGISVDEYYLDPERVRKLRALIK